MRSGSWRQPHYSKGSSHNDVVEPIKLSMCSHWALTCVTVRLRHVSLRVLCPAQRQDQQQNAQQVFAGDFDHDVDESCGWRRLRNKLHILRWTRYSASLSLLHVPPLSRAPIGRTTDHRNAHVVEEHQRAGLCVRQLPWQRTTKSDPEDKISFHNNHK